MDAFYMATSQTTLSHTDVFAPIGVAVVNERGQSRLRQGHVWVYKSDIIDAPGDQAGIVQVVSCRKRLLGLAFYSPKSQIMLRSLSRGSGLCGKAQLVQRLNEAWLRRKLLLPHADTYRLVHGEADFLPGIFIDQYQEYLVVQTTCAAADLWLQALVEALVTLLQPRGIVVRNDAKSRAKERLPQYVSVVFGEVPKQLTYQEGSVSLQIDLQGGQKTGAFLDQTYNHTRAAAYARGRGLDCFTYHGGFALQLARRCEQVLACDQSAAALEQAHANAMENNITNITFAKQDVLMLLPELLAQKAQFSTIVVDPPAFASTQGTVPRALEAYAHINMQAMQLLAPHGILVSCSCSGRVTADDFDTMLQVAARRAGRSIHIVERWSAGPDHPVLMGVPETDYLKARVLMCI